MIRKRVRFESFADGEGVNAQGMGWVDLCWDPADPLAVRFEFNDGVGWSIGSNLLLQGLRYPVGLGDVRLDPYPTRLAMTLNGRGRALVLLCRPAVDEFAEQLGEVDDTPDIDGLIQRIFEERAS